MKLRAFFEGNGDRGTAAAQRQSARLPRARPGVHPQHCPETAQKTQNPVFTCMKSTNDHRRGAAEFVTWASPSDDRVCDRDPATPSLRHQCQQRFSVTMETQSLPTFPQSLFLDSRPGDELRTTENLGSGSDKSRPRPLDPSSGSAQGNRQWL